MLEELREAKESQSPEMKHFLDLEKKIRHIETRHAIREQEIQKVHQSISAFISQEQFISLTVILLLFAQAHLAHTGGGKKYFLMQNGFVFGAC